MTILINVQHEPLGCNALCYEVIMEFMLIQNLSGSHDSAFSLAGILLRWDFIPRVHVSTDFFRFSWAVFPFHSYESKNQKAVLLIDVYLLSSMLLSLFIVYNEINFHECKIQ